MKKILILLSAWLCMNLTAVAQQGDAQSDSLARIVVKSFAEQDFTLLEKTILPNEAWSNYGAEWDSLPAATKIQIQKGARVRLKNNFDAILADAAERKIVLSKLMYEGVKIESNPEFHGEKGTDLMGMEIYFTYEGKKGNLAIAVFKAKGRLSTTEILKTTGVFELK